jgi:hypothetical protein
MFARLGFVARGIAYIVIGAIAVMLALGFARHEPDRAGAIEAIAASHSDTCCCGSWSSGSSRWPCGGSSTPPKSG